MTSKAQSEANVRYNRKMDSITIRPNRETGSKIRAAAAERGISVTEFILKSIEFYTGEPLPRKENHEKLRNH